MSIQVLASAGNDLTEAKADICIIGAGVAGLFAARRLAGSGHRVVIVESGLGDFDAAIHALNRVEDVRGQFGKALEGRYRGLGGSSTQWGGRMIPLTPHDMSARPYLGIDAWPLDPAELERYRPEIETLFEIDRGSFEESALDRFDPAHRIPRNDPDFDLRFPKWPTFRRCNLAYLFRDFLRDNAQLQIWLGATVTSFGLDEVRGTIESVTAADFGGRILTVRADKFLFAAGTIENTRLLLSLDRQAEGRVFAQCDALGRYFNDHLASGVGILRPRNRAAMNRWFGYYFADQTRRNLHIETSAAAQERDRVASSFAQVFLWPAEKSGLNVVKNVLRGLQRGKLDMRPRDLAYLLKDAWPMALTGYWRYVRNQLYIPQSVPLNLNIWAEQAPRRGNHIALSQQLDALGQPMARIDWSADAQDERTFRTCLVRLRGFWKRSGLEQVCPVDWSDAARDPNGVIAAKSEDAGHPAGTTRMGRVPRQSVVDPDLRCHHIANAWVASASVFPSSGSANPTYTIMQIALRAAEKMAAAKPVSRPQPLSGPGVE